MSEFLPAMKRQAAGYSPERIDYTVENSCDCDDNARLYPVRKWHVITCMMGATALRRKIRKYIRLSARRQCNFFPLPRPPGSRTCVCGTFRASVADSSSYRRKYPGQSVVCHVRIRTSGLLHPVSQKESTTSSNTDGTLDQTTCRAPAFF